MTIYKPLGLTAAVAVWFGSVTLHAQPSPGTETTPVQVTIPNATFATPDASAVDSESDSDLAKKLQNPVGDLISVPFQNNTNFNVGPQTGTQNILNIQPVIPMHLNQDWNLITRTILPLIWSPTNQPIGPSVPFGLSATSASAFLSPSTPVNGWIWGAGPVVELPTITNQTLGSNVWGLGPTAVVVKLAGPIVAGALVNNVFSLGGTSGPAGNRYSLFTFNPFFNYNFEGGWFAGSVPIITANWDGPSTKWTLPVGGQVGRLIKIGGKLPANLLIGA